MGGRRSTSTTPRNRGDSSSKRKDNNQQPPPSSTTLAAEKIITDSNDNNSHNIVMSSKPLPSAFPSSSISEDDDSSQHYQSSASPIYHHHHYGRPYKGFSTPFTSLFQTSGGLPTYSTLDIANNTNNNTQQQQQMMTEEHNQYIQNIQISNLRTDICSLSCFGICQSDQTKYLFTNKRPPTFFYRLLTNLFIPIVLFLVAGYCAGHIENEYLNNVICTLFIYCIVVWYVLLCVKGRRDRIMVREEILWKLHRRERKIRFRMEERGMMGRRSVGGGGRGGLGGQQQQQYYDIPYNVASVETETEYEYYSDEDNEKYHREDYDPVALGQTRFEMNCAHRMCGCYPSDIMQPPGGGASSVNNMDHDESSGYILHPTTPSTPAFNNNSNNGGDLCTKLWNGCYTNNPCLSYRCCLPWCCGSYGCHLQFCGFCALAQEAREANLILPRYMRMVDYITMEPFLLYYPRILELRELRSGSFLEHFAALSSLSRIILQSLTVVLVSMLMMSLLNAITLWNLTDMGVLGATLLQAFGVMYVVHWGWHRFDLSVDAVIKYFACGFLLSTSMAFGVELMEYLMFRLITFGVVTLLGVEEVEDDGYYFHQRRSLLDEEASGHTTTRFLVDDADILKGFFSDHPEARIVYIFVTAYLMTGLVEELCKYFGFVMVDHPDFCSDYELAKSKETISAQISRSRSGESEGDVSHITEQTPEAVAVLDPSMQKRTLSSIRAGVTVAMVAIALGFTCCENILHIFVYNRSSLQSKITTLIAKALCPVHPLAAAIQSIYVCRRDLEKDPSIGLGRVVLPAVLFHGTYDFALLFISDSWKRSQASQYFYSGDTISKETIMTLLISLAVILIGWLFYIVQSRRQYERLSRLSNRISEVQIC